MIHSMKPIDTPQMELEVSPCARMDVARAVEETLLISRPEAQQPDAGRTDHEKYEDERTEEGDGIIVPPYLLRESRKTSVGGDNECDEKQDGYTDWRGLSVGDLPCEM